MLKQILQTQSIQTVIIFYPKLITIVYNFETNLLEEKYPKKGT